MKLEPQVVKQPTVSNRHKKLLLADKKQQPAAATVPTKPDQMQISGPQQQLAKHA